MSLIYMPGDFGIKLRQILYKPFFKSCGKRVYIDQGVLFSGMKFMSFGDDVHIDKNCIINAGDRTRGSQKYLENNNFKGKKGEIIFGSHIHVVQNCIIMGFGGVQIADHCTLSAGTKVYSQSNIPYNPENRSEIVSIIPYSTAHFVNGPVTLDENVWVGLNCVVMPGSHIGKNSFVVSYSLVKDTYSENSYLKGQPAEKIRARFENQ